MPLLCTYVGFTSPSATCSRLWHLIVFYIPQARVPLGQHCGKMGCTAIRGASMPSGCQFFPRLLLKSQVLTGEWRREAEEYRRTRAPAAYVGDQDEVTGSWLQSLLQA